MDLAARIPPWYKLCGLKEKLVLKKAMRDELPEAITRRVKQPYMAPDSNSFFCDEPPDYVEDVLSEDSLRRARLFDPGAVSKLKAKCARMSHTHLSFRDNMSFVGILSTQLLVR